MPRGRGAVQTPAKRARPAGKYRQAQQQPDGTVEVLCFSCRRAPSASRQSALSSFFRPACSAAGRPSEAPAVRSEVVCSRCRRPMTQAKPKSSPASLTALPHLTRLKGYKRVAKEQNVPFGLSDHRATELMRRPCTLCGAPADQNGNGLTRLRVWPAEMEASRAAAVKAFMGPFVEANLATACARCNLMKGARTVAGFVEAARTIATHRCAGDYGRYPDRFRDNVSKRSRSSYITQSSTHTKTHALTNEQFREITGRPCHYCGKRAEPSKPHYNGLDRLDSDDRVYSVETVVSCCGDCNVMKYKHSEQVFLDHCVKVSEYHVGVEFGGEEQESEPVVDVAAEGSESEQTDDEPVRDTGPG